MENLELAAKEVGGLRLPPGLEPLEVAGKGSRSITFRANYRGSILAMKVYRPDVIDNYRKKYDLNIAVFEMSRNRAFRKIPELLPFAAKPISVMGHDGRCSLLFLQEFIEAVPLKELAEKDKGLPDSVLEAGATIVRVAEQNGLHDLDLYYKDVLLRKQSDIWLPVLHDFNLVSQHEHPSNPIMALAFKSGMRKKSQRDHRHLEQWRGYSERCAR